MKSKFIFAIVFASTLWVAAYLYFTHKPVPPTVDRGKIYAVYDPINVGEMNMIKSIENACSQLNYADDFIEMPKAQLQELKLDKTKNNTIITAGQFGINWLNSAVLPNNVKILLCVHQWFDAMQTLHDIYLAIPSYVIDAKIKQWAKHQRIKLLPTQGVVHNMSLKSLDEQDTSMIHLSKAKIGLILAGDAAMPNGKDWQLFTAQDAQELAHAIAALIKKTGNQLLITNGPRTGAFITTTTRKSNAHKNGTIDDVSQAFLAELVTAGLQPGKDFEFFDFQHGIPSALNAILAIVHQNKGFMIVPGESVSSISEITSILPTTIYSHNAMNSSHKAYLNEVITNKFASLWPDIPNTDLDRYDYARSHPAPGFELVQEFLSLNNSSRDTKD